MSNLTCEHCVHAKLCKGKYTRDLFIDAFRYFEKPDGSLKVMEVVVENCGEFKQHEDETLKDNIKKRKGNK